MIIAVTSAEVVTYCYSAKTRRLKFCAEMGKPSSTCEKVKIVKYKVHVELFKPLVLDEHDRVLHTLKLRNPQGSTNEGYLVSEFEDNADNFKKLIKL